MSLDSLFSSLSEKVKGDPKALLGSLLGGAGTQGRSVARRPVRWCPC
jgi:hypothetical protein